MMTTRLWCSLSGAVLVALGMGFVSSSPVFAQDRQAPTLTIAGFYPSGLRTSVTQSWGTLDFSLANHSDQDRQARVLVYYADEPDVQFGRDLWVPARSSLRSLLLFGPAPEYTRPTPLGKRGRTIKMVLQDHSQGTKQIILPQTEEKERERAVPYRPREATTTILLDEFVPEPSSFGHLPRPESRADEAMHLVRVFRRCRELPQTLSSIRGKDLPTMPEAFEGIDHFVIASGCIANDPAGLRALRRWLQRGGRVWIMLDLLPSADIDAVVGPLLGEAFDFQVVDQVSLTTFQVETSRQSVRRQPQPVQEHERPVELTRVLLPPHEQPMHTVNGWPIWFSRQVGRGKVVFTTLGPSGWVQTRTEDDPPSPERGFPNLGIPTVPLERIAQELDTGRFQDPIQPEAFAGVLTREIGYTIVPRSTVGWIFISFLAGTLALGVLLRRFRRPELLGWVAPAVALATASVFVLLGESSRRAVPPTMAVGQIVDAVSGVEEASVRGLLAMYRPTSGPVSLGAEKGGFFELDMTGLQGKERLLILSDLDSWRWENVSLPAGVRMASFRSTISTAEPISAVARFGPQGVQGKLRAGPFADVSDAILTNPGNRNIAIDLSEDGTFTATSTDILPQGEFLAGTLLSDQQQRRQALYREFLKKGGPGSLPRGTFGSPSLPEGRTVLLAWASPMDLHFTLGAPARTGGDALLIVPLQLERPAPGSRLTIPGPLLSCRRILDQSPTRLVHEGAQATDMHLRFQLPVELLPLTLERARLMAKIDAPSRQITVSGRTDDTLVELHKVESPLDPLQVDITDERLLTLDAQGGFHVNFSISKFLAGRPARQSMSGLADRWTIRYLELEVTARTPENHHP